MRFRQLDTIVEIKPGVEVIAERTISDRDRYFMDHFPDFYVVPGVLTLEAMFQACDWLTRKTDDFRHSVVMLKEARGVKFTGMVRPGDQLIFHARIKKWDDLLATFIVSATVNGKTAAQARMVVERYSLADRYPARAATDPYLHGRKQELFQLLSATSPNHLAAEPTNFRWMWIDRFTEFESGKRARSMKNVSLTDEPIDLYLPGFPVLPCSLVVEGFAMTGGILASEVKNFEEQVVLAKVNRAVFHRPALAGDQIEYFVEIVELLEEGAVLRGQSRIGDDVHCDIEFFIAYLGDSYGLPEMVPPVHLLRLLRLYGLYEVAHDAQGEVLAVPERMLDAEKTAGTSR